MSSDKKTPPGMISGGAAVYRVEEGPARAHGRIDPNTPTILAVRWKVLSDNYAVLATEDGKAAGWVSRELDDFGNERIRYGIGGLKVEAKSWADARSIVVSHLADSAQKVGLVLRVLNVRRND